MERDLGYRRVQSTGRGSYIISLPKEWVQDLNLERGSEVAFKLQDDSSLLLIPAKNIEEKKATAQRLEEYWILVEPSDDPQSLIRKITSLYAVSAEVIHIRFKGSDVSRYKAAVNSLAKNALLGAEIIDETSNEITLQILIKHSDFPVEKAIRRMATIALSANRDAILALKGMDEGLIRNVVETCNDVNRVSLYAIRQLKFGLEQDLFRELGFKTPKEFLGYRIVVNDIKSIADNAMNIVNNIITLKKLTEDQMLFLKEPVDEEIYSEILSFNSKAHQLFEESLKALFKRSYEDADKVMAKLGSLSTLENDIITSISNKKLDPNVSSIFRLMLDSSRRTLEYSRDTAEVTQNRTVEEISSTEAI